MRIYLNTSALNRPFDDLSAQRVRLEAEAVSVIVSAIETGQLQLVSSDYLDFEVAQIPDPERAQRVRTILDYARSRIAIGEDVAERARALEQVGLRGLDALHLAAAEGAGARLLITTDDRMIQRARRLGDDLGVRVVLPIDAIGMIEEEKDPRGTSES